MGGNDVSWAGVVAACGTSGSAAACDALLQHAPELIARAAASAARTVDAVDAATEGRIVVLG